MVMQIKLVVVIVVVVANTRCYGFAHALSTSQDVGWSTRLFLSFFFVKLSLEIIFNGVRNKKEEFLEYENVSFSKSPKLVKKLEFFFR